MPMGISPGIGVFLVIAGYLSKVKKRSQLIIGFKASQDESEAGF